MFFTDIGILKLLLENLYYQFPPNVQHDVIMYPRRNKINM